MQQSASAGFGTHLSGATPDLFPGSGVDPFSDPGPFAGSGSGGFPGTGSDPSGWPDLGSVPGPVAGGVGGFTAVVIGLMALAGVAVVVGGLWTAVRARRRAAEVRAWGTSGRTATGTVVDNRMQSRTTSFGGAGVGDTGTWPSTHRLTFSPVVRFAADGQEVTVTGDQVSNRSFVVGRPARVVYDPAVPERAHVVAEGGSRWGAGAGGLATAASGVVFLLVLAGIAGVASGIAFLLP